MVSQEQFLRFQRVFQHGRIAMFQRVGFFHGKKRHELALAANVIGALVAFGLFFGLGGLDPNFRLIITKPDNVPIVGLIFLLVFFVW